MAAARYVMGGNRIGLGSGGALIDADILDEDCGNCCNLDPARRRLCHVQGAETTQHEREHEYSAKQALEQRG